MQLKLHHRWGVPFSKIWPNPGHVPTPVKDSYVSFFACHLYPNGDLLVVLHGVQQTAVGYGLVTPTAAPGTTLALRVAAQVARIHGGRLNAGARGGDGERFVLELPRAAARA